MKSGRRQFLTALAGSTAALSLKKITKAFGLAPQGSGAPDRSRGSRQRALRGVVVYYSATGSTAKIAKAIHRGMRSAMACDLVKLNKKADPQKMTQYDVIGIGGPVWYFRETANLKHFIYKMPRMEGKLCFPFCSHGSEPIGFMYSISQSLLKKRLTIIGWNDWYGSVTQVLHMPKPYLTDGHPDEIDLKEAEAFGREMAERAQRIAAGDKSVIPELPTGPDADPLWIRNDQPEALGGPRPRTGSAIGTGPLARAVSAAGAGATQVVSVMKSKTAKTGSVKSATMGAATSAAVGPGGSPPGAGGPGEPREPMPGGMSAPSGGVPYPGGPTVGGPGGGPPPGGPGGEGPSPGGPGGGRPPRMPIHLPNIDMAKCVYPRCTACADSCPVDVIDFSLATPGRSASGTLLIRSGCIGCGLCERVCFYDAVTWVSPFPKTKHVIDRKKCTYPKCTLCVDHCPMDCIDFSQNPPVFHNRCEGCDLCYCVCPYDAISIPNLSENHMRLRMNDPNHPFVRAVEKYENAGRFRRLVPLDKVGWNNPVFMNKNAPRLVLNADDEATYCATPCPIPKKLTETD